MSPRLSALGLVAGIRQDGCFGSVGRRDCVASILLAGLAASPGKALRRRKLSRNALIRRSSRWFVPRLVTSVLRGQLLRG
jgi:hypothetical protein